MSMTQQEIEEALAHQKNMLGVLRRRLQQRELQEVQYGINVPPEITSDIYILAERIRSYETELTRLETVAAEDHISLAEAQYRVLLAEVLGTPQGRPTLAGATRLELERLRLGVRSERAHSLENEIRQGLVQELFFDICFNDFAQFIYKLGSRQEQTLTKEQPLLILGRMIRLDWMTAVCLFLELLSPPIYEIDMDAFVQAVWDVNRVRKYLGDFMLFDEFFTALPQMYETKKTLVNEWKKEAITQSQIAS